MAMGFLPWNLGAP
jgi:hypothetical protein